MKDKKNLLSSLIIILAGALNHPMLAQVKNDANSIVYQLDIKKSKLFWQAPKNQHNGFILFNSGSLSNFSAGQPTQGTFSINMNSMRSTDEASDAGRKEVDDKLRSEDFFAVSRYPAATMVVRKMLRQANGTTYKVYGELTIKGVTKPIEFTTLMKQKDNTITAKAHLSISRENWNINRKPEQKTWDFIYRIKDNLIDNDIPVRLDLVFTKK